MELSQNNDLKGIGYGSKRWWPSLRCFPGICLEGLKKTGKTSFRMAGLGAGTSKYSAMTLNFRSGHGGMLVFFCCVLCSVSRYRHEPMFSLSSPTNCIKLLTISELGLSEPELGRGPILWKILKN
jgi:hypothetical protein